MNKTLWSAIIESLKETGIEILEPGSTIFYPHIDHINDIYEVRRRTVKWIGSIANVEHWLIELYYDVETEGGSTSKINLMGKINTKKEWALKELIEFAEKQIKPIEEHNVKLKAQLAKNKLALEKFLKLKQ
jgi:hypothetical protein